MNEYRKYYEFDIKSQSESAGINITTTGVHDHDPFQPYPDKNHPDSYVFDWNEGRSIKEYQLVYISDGEGYFEVEGMPPLTIQKGTILLIYPEIWHRYKPKEETGWKEYWVGFKGEYAKYLLEQKCFDPNDPIIKIGFNIELIQCFDRLFTIIEDKNIDYKKFMSFVLIQMLSIVYFNVLTREKEIGRKQQIVNSVISDISKRWNEKIDFEDLAIKNNISYSLLRKEFKIQTQTTLKQYHLNIQLRKAEQMILESDFSISEISDRCGFENIQTFSKMFKKKMGKLPSKLRN